MGDVRRSEGSPVVLLNSILIVWLLLTSSWSWSMSCVLSHTASIDFSFSFSPRQ
jgi:hypothetical protein